MGVEPYEWPAADQFLDRRPELDRLEAWWRSPDREPVNLYGRRRVGKSWLFRRFAHGRPAVLLVADRLAAGQQWSGLADQLAGPLGVRPAIDGIADLFRVLYRLGREQKVLVVVDEFPYLLGTTTADQQAGLSAVQAVMEAERDSSRAKLVLTGSTVGQMEALQAERSPMHGRLMPLPLRPLAFPAARLFMAGLEPLDQVTRYAVTGGMPRYLAAMGTGDLVDVVASRVMDRLGPFFVEPRTVLQTELRESAVYFSVLSTLGTRPQSVTAIGEALRMPTKELGRYLEVLEGLQLVARRRPAGSRPESRSTQWYCDDHFLRFWFRFVAPRQAELEAGADPRAVATHAVPRALADHTAPAFEEIVRSWVRGRWTGRATEVGAWWGNAVNALRATRARFSEEVDVVALDGRRVLAVAEAKWTGKPLDARVLHDLLTYKLPAMAQAGLDVAGAEVLLVARSGFTAGIRDLAAARGVELVGAEQVLAELGAG